MPDFDDIRIPTVPVAVSLRLSNGRSEEVTVFLSRTSAFHEGPETLDEFLASGRKFIAVQPREGRAYLVGIDAIVSLTVLDSAPILSRLPGRVPSSINFVRVRLENGTEFEGTLLANQPPDLSRVSDIFNLSGEFIPLEAGDQVVYIRKACVARVDL